MKNTDYRQIAYTNYLQRPQNADARGYTPNAMPPELGAALYGDALAAADRAAPAFEIGAGEGHFLVYLRDQGFTRAYGVDLSAPMVEHARQRQVDVRLENGIEHLAALPDNHLGLVVAIDIIEHLNKPEIIDLLRHTLRTLKPGGVLIVKTVNGQGLFKGQVMYGDVTHTTMLNPGSLGQLLAMTGFTEPVFRESTFFGRGKREWLRRKLWPVIKAITNLCRWVESGKTQTIWSENMICWTRKPAP